MKKSELKQLIKEEITSMFINESNNWKRGNPKKEGYYAIIFDPKNLMGGQEYLILKGKNIYFLRFFLRSIIFIIDGTYQKIPNRR